MDNKVKKFGIVLGVGGLGYWAFRAFRKSDGSFYGAVSEAGNDINKGCRSTIKAAKRILTTIGSAANRWQKSDSPTSAPFIKLQGDRGNGSTIPGAPNATLQGTDMRSQTGPGKTI